MARSKKVKKRQALRSIVRAIREAGHCANCHLILHYEEGKDAVQSEV